MRRKNALLCSLATVAVLASPVAAQTCALPIAKDCLNARPAVLPQGKFAYGQTAEGDAWVARFEPGATTPVWRATVGGSRAETIEAIALRADGKELLVAGGSASATIAGFRGHGSGGADGIVFRLEVATGRLLGGAFVGGPADDLLTGVAEGAAGEVLVAGTSSELPRPLGKAPAELIQLVPADPGPDAATTLAFVSSLGTSGEAEVFRHVLGPIAVEHPRVWIDCHGNIVVGTFFAVAAPCSGGYPDLVYEQDQIAQDYDVDTNWSDPLLGFPPGGFGFHALRWKEYHANATASPPFVLDWSLVTSPAVPKDWNPTCSDAGALNLLETQVLLQSGVPVDPPGGWMCGNHADVAQLALFASHLHHRWGTSVYTHFGFWDNLNGPWTWYTQPVAIERTVFEPYCLWDPSAYSGETLDDLCDLDVDHVTQLTCTTSAGIPGVAGTGFFLKLKHFEGAEWGLPLVWSQRFAAWDPDTTYFWQEWYEPGEYLMDPPAGAENEVAILEEASRQLAGLVTREGRVTATRIQNGVPACSEELSGTLPAGQ